MTTTTATEQQIATVAGIYESFGRGDIPAILDTLADDVVWDTYTQPTSAQEAGIEYLAERRGAADVGAFFESLAAIDITHFDVKRVFGSDDCVVAEIDLTATVKATGKSFSDNELHFWEFDDSGAVTHYRHFVDTGRHMEAHRS